MPLRVILALLGQYIKDSLGDTLIFYGFIQRSRTGSSNYLLEIFPLVPLSRSGYHVRRKAEAYPPQGLMHRAPCITAETSALLTAVRGGLIVVTGHPSLDRPRLPYRDCHSRTSCIHVRPAPPETPTIFPFGSPSIPLHSATVIKFQCTLGDPLQ